MRAFSAYGICILTQWLALIVYEMISKFIGSEVLKNAAFLVLLSGVFISGYLLRNESFRHKFLFSVIIGFSTPLLLVAYFESLSSFLKGDGGFAYFIIIGSIASTVYAIGVGILSWLFKWIAVRK